MKYRAEIDGLRAVAVVPVILFHAGFEFFGGGYVGVDIFFVISGYLITTIIINELDEGRFSLVTFYERRARRILPALFFIMLLCLPFAWVWLTPRDLADFARSVMAVSVFASNILFWQESGYFSTAAELKPLLHTWSLAVEEQYYIIFPLLLMSTWRFGKSLVIALLIIGFFASLGLAQWAIQDKPWAAFFLLPTRGWELLIGAFCAFYLQRFPTRSGGPAAQMLGILGLGLIALAVFMFDAETPVPGVHALIPTLGTALIILFASKLTLVGQVLSQRYIVGIGLVSYSAYLWHQPLFAFARHRQVSEPSEALMLVLSLASVGLAVLTWKFIETPFRNKARVTRRTIFQAAIIGSGFFIAIGLSGHMKNGFPDRFTSNLAGDIGDDIFYQYMEDKFLNCQPKPVAEAADYYYHKDILRCKQSQEGHPEIVLLGDSHAEHLFIGLADALPERNVAFYTKGEKPYLDIGEFTAIFEELLQNGRKQTILLTMHYWERVAKYRPSPNLPPRDRESFAETFRKFKKYQPDQQISASEIQAFYKEFKTMIDALNGAGKDVILIGDIPRYSIEPDVCVYQIKDTYGKVHPLCHMLLSLAEAQKNTYHLTLKRLSQELDVRYVDLYPVVCGDTQCSMIRGNQIIYRDDDHFNIFGSRLAAGYILDQILDIRDAGHP